MKKLELPDIDQYILSKRQISVSFWLMTTLLIIGYVLIGLAFANAMNVIMIPFNKITEYVIISLCISFIAMISTSKMITYVSDLVIENTDRLMISARYHEIMDIMEKQSDENLPF